MFVPARAARAGRRVRRELLDAGRRLREPRALRAARLVTRRHRRDDPRRGLVPPAARRHHHQPARRRRAPAHGSSATASTTPSCAAGRSAGPGKPIHYVGRMHARRGAAAPRPRRLPRRAVREARPTRVRTACPASPTPDPRGAATSAFIEAVWRSLPGRATTWLGRPVATAPDRPARVPGDHRRRSGPTGSSRPAPATAGGRCSSRRSASCSATARCVSIDAGRSPTTCPAHPRITYLRGAGPRRGDGRARSASIVGDAPGARGARLLRRPATTIDRVRRVRAARAGRLVRRRRRHDRERPSGVAGVRPRSGRGGQADHRARTSSSPIPTMEKYSLTFNPGGFLDRVQ